MSQAPTPRTRVRRIPELGVYDRDRVHAILDEAIYCHLAWVADDGDPRVIPTIHTRIDDTLYVHGSAASSTLRAIKQGLAVAIAVTLVDGIRFARSMFEHSMNYRTVIVYGEAQEVTDRDELAQVFDAITDHVAPGRSADARPPSDDELRQTTFVKVALDECSAKVSEGFPEEPDDDLALDVWAGVLPLRTVPGEPVGDPLLREGTEVPAYVADYRRPGQR
ncbi:MAG: pyridoxamine 5'-phosphate oxidase family protein [Actinomycetota bacterium]|nr:pyridoxamine 5'-phosphate oxidase family protein [Actinomycetota bacterium]MDH5313645.1 pyridoxamine 5'-phosphate oxidase family protein [Actinomycetota bacterium]